MRSSPNRVSGAFCGRNIRGEALHKNCFPVLSFRRSILFVICQAQAQVNRPVRKLKGVDTRDTHFEAKEKMKMKSNDFYLKRAQNKDLYS